MSNSLQKLFMTAHICLCVNFYQLRLAIGQELYIWDTAHCWTLQFGLLGQKE